MAKKWKKNLWISNVPIMQILELIREAIIVVSDYQFVANMKLIHK